MIDVFVLNMLKAPSQQALAPFLQKQDWNRAQSYKNAYLQQRYLCSRAVLRQQLAFHMQCSPQSIVISLTAHQKPVVANGPYFSISHSYPFTSIALANHPIGVDIENTLGPIDPVLLDVCLSPAEKARWPEHNDFYTYWCAKEATLKAHGTGLLYDPRKITLARHDKNTFTTQVEDQDFYIHYEHIDGNYLLALAQPMPFSQVTLHSWCSLRSFFS